MISYDVEKNDDKLKLESSRSCVQRLSNQTVLAITCAMFTAFVIAEIIGALVSPYTSKLRFVLTGTLYQ